jgi:ribosomal protein S18 acetylase RimI-like enzyme
VGRQLLRVIALELKRKGCASLMLWVLEENAARKFYERIGGRLLSARKISQGMREVAYGWAAIVSLYE